MLKSFSAQTNALGALNYKGTWDATANSPALASSVGTKGDYYVVSVAGSTTLNGISNWGIGDWAVFNGSVWQRVEGGADVNAVNLTASGTSVLSGKVTAQTLTIGLGGQTSVANNTALGFEALNSASLTGTENTGVGYQALRAATTGSNNNAVGRDALYSNTTGGNNNAVGRDALYSNTTGGQNSAIGRQALFFNTTGSDNSAVGNGALFVNNTGSGNSAVGLSALRENTTGSNSSAHGFEALRRFVSTGNQVAVGYRALYGGDATPANNTGSQNIAIGYQAGDAITTGSTNIAIGYDVDVDSATGSNQINIGDRYFHDRIRLLERTSDPAKPAEGNMIVWLSDGTGLGDDGDVIISSTAGGVTNYAILFDHSAGTLWP